MLLPLNKKPNSGQSYLDLIISAAILLILSGALLTLVNSALQLVSFTRARITARQLGTEKIELVRNLPYDEVGTIGGIPNGPLPQEENVFRNGLNYFVQISIIYIDDPFDQLAPDDLLPTDYKRVRVNVSWEGVAASAKNPITLITDIAPKGVETTEGGGTLSVLVFDANAQPVGQANVHIVANEVTPSVDLNLQTSSDGRIILPGALTCVACYQITVSKDGYSQDRTYSQEEVANPEKPQQTILENQLTEVSFAIDKVSTLVVYSTQGRENNFAPLASQMFYLKGEKTIGTDVADEPIYKFDQSFITNSLGQMTISNLEWDNYHIILPAGSGWNISGTNPLIPILVLPNLELEASFALVPYTNHNLLTVFKNSSQAPIASVSARLYDSLDFEATASSGTNNNPDFGQVFFTDLEEKTYNLEATASGFLNYNGSVSISGETKEEIIMEEK